MTKDRVLRKTKIGDCVVVVCGGIAGKYIVRFIGDSFLELEYLDKLGGEIDCRIGFRSIQAIEAI